MNYGELRKASPKPGSNEEMVRNRVLKGRKQATRRTIGGLAVGGVAYGLMAAGLAIPVVGEVGLLILAGAVTISGVAKGVNYIRRTFKADDLNDVVQRLRLFQDKYIIDPKTRFETVTDEQGNTWEQGVVLKFEPIAVGTIWGLPWKGGSPHVRRTAIVRDLKTGEILKDSFKWESGKDNSKLGFIQKALNDSDIGGALARSHGVDGGSAHLRVIRKGIGPIDRFRFVIGHVKDATDRDLNDEYGVKVATLGIRVGIGPNSRRRAELLRLVKPEKTGKEREADRLRTSAGVARDIAGAAIKMAVIEPEEPLHGTTARAFSAYADQLNIDADELAPQVDKITWRVDGVLDTARYLRRVKNPDGFRARLRLKRAQRSLVSAQWWGRESHVKFNWWTTLGR